MKHIRKVINNIIVFILVVLIISYANYKINGIVKPENIEVTNKIIKGNLSVTGDMLGRLILVPQIMLNFLISPFGMMVWLYIIFYLYHSYMSYLLPLKTTLTYILVVLFLTIAGFALRKGSL